jgi:hypothetical protein
LNGTVLKRSWAGEVHNVSLLVAIGVNSEGYRETLGICEGAKQDKACWSGFLKHLSKSPSQRANTWRSAIGKMETSELCCILAYDRDLRTVAVGRQTDRQQI